MLILRIKNVPSNDSTIFLPIIRTPQQKQTAAEGFGVTDAIEKGIGKGVRSKHREHTGKIYGAEPQRILLPSVLLVGLD